MVVRDDVGVTVLGLVHFQVGMLPRELLAGVDGLQGEVRGGGVGVRHWGAGWGREAGAPAYLVLLGEFEAVVGLEALRVLGHVCDGDRGVAEHAWEGEKQTPRCGPVTRRPASGSGGGDTLQCESVMDALWLERVVGVGRVQDGPRWGREPRPAGLSACGWGVQGAAPS